MEIQGTAQNGIDMNKKAVKRLVRECEWSFIMEACGGG